MEAIRRIDIGGRFVAILIPATITANLVGKTFPLALAWAASTFAWVMVIYWIPSRLEKPLLSWIGWGLILGLLASGLSLLGLS